MAENNKTPIYNSIDYKIEFFTYWHCGSGLAKGADVDALVVKDKKHLPYVPGKTVKGLLREAVETLLACKGDDKAALVREAFGIFEKDKNGDRNKDKSEQGCMFFTNAELPEADRQAIVARKYQQHLYRSVASTKIDDKTGIAEDASLRKMEVVVPCELFGSILDVPSDLASDMVEAFGLVKRMGVNRNRGLGRCEIALVGVKEVTNN